MNLEQAPGQAQVPARYLNGKLVCVIATDYGSYAVTFALSQSRLLAACPGCAARLDPCRVRAAVARWERRQREHTRVLAWSRVSYRVTAREESDHQRLMVSLGPAPTQAPGFRS